MESQVGSMPSAEPGAGLSHNTDNMTWAEIKSQSPPQEPPKRYFLFANQGVCVWVVKKKAQSQD